MNKTAVAREIVRIARSLAAIVFDTQDQLDEYLKAHPGADKSTHSVKPKAEKAPMQEQKPEQKPQSQPQAQPTAQPAHPLKKVAPTRTSISKVDRIMSANGIKNNSDELKELTGFKKTLGHRIPEKDVGKYYVRNEAKLKKDFLSNMSASNYPTPEAFKAAKDRINKMPKGDFAELLAAVSAEDEETA